ncbi:MAG: heteromeric transposase endonuclease subunit TnsA, partial [Nitrospirae bacterium]|nr:heteromeric transposase endonuclease subunit TnsA [Nitrospirota bacterium]
MPVRKIPRNYRNITGAVSRSNGDPMVRYESALERDFYELLDFDINVRSYE